MNRTNSKEIKQHLSEKGRKKLDCKVCGKLMANKGSLYTHIRATHEEVKYSCQQCLYQATRKGLLKSIEGQFMKEYNTFLGKVSIKQQQQEIKINIEGQFMKN